MCYLYYAQKRVEINLLLTNHDNACATIDIFLHYYIFVNQITNFTLYYFYIMYT
jgi:hypothetical protein